MSRLCHAPENVSTALSFGPVELFRGFSDFACAFSEFFFVFVVFESFLCVDFGGSGRSVAFWVCYSRWLDEGFFENLIFGLVFDLFFFC